MRLPGKITMLKLLTVLCWVVLFVVLLQRDHLVGRLEVHEGQVLEKAEQESFIGVYFKGERIGFVKNRLEPRENDTFALHQQAVLNLTVLDANYPVEMEVHAGLTPAFLLTDFRFSMSSPFYAMQARGEVAGRRVSFVLDTGKDEIRDAVILTAPPMLSLNQRGYLLRENLQIGEKRSIVYFDPLSLTGKEVLVEYRGLEKTLVQGRVHLLHHFSENFAGIRISSWLDETGKVVMEESPAGFVFVSEPEFRATSISRKGEDILQSVAVPYAGDLTNLAKAERIAFRLELPDEVSYELDGGRQRWRDGIVVISREEFGAADTAVCPDITAELAATPYIQTDHPGIRAMAEQITAGRELPLDRVRALLDWVYDTIEKRPVIGIPDAATTLRTRRGDCNEHAVLFAALARASGVPTRIAAGVTWHDNAFYYHAWNEVCLGGQWLSLDATKNQLPADLSHIRFVIGETAEQIRIGALLGTLRILPAEEEKQ